MSIKVSSLVWRAKLPSTQKLVAARLADFADDDGGKVFPSNGRVARETGLSDRSVREAYRALEALGALILVTMEDPGRRIPREYRFDLEVLAGLAVADQPNPNEGGTTFPPEPASPRNHVPPTPEPRSANPPDNPPIPAAGDGGTGAKPKSQTMAIGDRIAEMAGWDQSRWGGNYSLVAAWLSWGWDPDLDILPTVARLMADRHRRGQGPPGGLKYFEGAIRSDHETRTAPKPEGPINDQRRHAPQRSKPGQRTVDRGIYDALAPELESYRRRA